MSILAIALLSLARGGALSPTQLRCEYLTNPLGIEETHPRLSWVDVSKARGARQTAYRILVSGSMAGRGDLWDSGKVSSSESTQIAYAGKPLASRQKAYWQVQIWDAFGGSSTSREAATWEMGLLNRSDWKAQWIGLQKPKEDKVSLEGASWIWYPEANQRGDMPHGSCFLHKDFAVDSLARVDYALLEATADDHFKVTLNGKGAGAGDGWQTIKTIDLKALLKQGENELVVEGINDAGKAGVAAVVKIHYSNGKDQVLYSDASWQAAKKLGDKWGKPLIVGPVGMSPWGRPAAPITNGPAPYMRRPFVVKSPVVKARIYASALGLYKLYLDGKLVSGDLLRPGWTDYKKRVQYQTYDVPESLDAGSHAIGMVLGNGWYCGRVGWTAGQNYGPQAMGLAQLELTHADGKVDRICTDASWEVSTGPILSDDLLDGEAYDARREIRNFTEPPIFPPPIAGSPKHSGGRHWWDVPLVQPIGKIALNAQQSPSVQELQELRPLTIKEIPKGSFVFDLGQNMVGWARLRVKGPAGTTVRLRFAEMLNPDGSIYVTNLRGAKATDTYTLNGFNEEEFEPSFTFHGFRYVEVTGYPGKPTKDAITGIVVGSNNPKVGEFACSNDMVNKLAKNIFWGQRGNYVDVPTDCPQRDERLGWMGDAQIFSRTATYNNDIAAFMTKWTRDVEDAQSPKGGYSDVSPRMVDGGDGAPAWGDAGVIVPWTMYQAYGDKRILAVHYKSMAKWISYIDDVNPDHIWVKRSNANFGDWLNVQDDTPREVLATAYFAHSTDLLGRAAEVLGKKDDAAKYRALLGEIKKAFNEKFVAPDGKIKGDTQTDYVLSLWFDLLPEQMKQNAVNRLSAHIMTDRKGHLSTGFVGVGYLCPTLTKYGRTDIAYKLLNNDTYPSWGYSIRQGATTIWERWDGWRADKGFQNPGMNSFNHYSLGSVGEWMYNWILGIDMDPANPGYRHILLHPAPGGGMGWAKGSLMTPYGKVDSSWRLRGTQLIYDVTVPANTTATLTLPCSTADSVSEGGRNAAKAVGIRAAGKSNGHPVYELGGGTYHFTVTTNR